MDLNYLFLETYAEYIPTRALISTSIDYTVSMHNLHISVYSKIVLCLIGCKYIHLCLTACPYPPSLCSLASACITIISCLGWYSNVVLTHTRNECVCKCETLRRYACTLCIHLYPFMAFWCNSKHRLERLKAEKQRAFNSSIRLRLTGQRGWSGGQMAKHAEIRTSEDRYTLYLPEIHLPYSWINWCPACAWLSSGALEVWRLRIRLLIVKFWHLLLLQPLSTIPPSLKSIP